MRIRSTFAAAAALSLALAACGGGDDPAVTGGDTTTEATTDQMTDDGGEATDDANAGGGGEGGSLSFSGTDQVKWEEPSKSVAPGTIDVTLECGAAAGHTLAIEGVNGDAEITACDPGASGSGTVDLEAGEYTFFCTVPGHRDAGMEGTLTVG